MTKKNILYLSAFAIILFISIGFSSLADRLGINDLSLNVRLAKDIRITRISLDNPTSNAVSHYEDYNINSVNMGVTLNSQTSKVTYKIDITNVGNVEMGLTNITGLPTNLKYTLTNLNLNEKICNENNKCKLGITKTVLLTIEYNDNGYNPDNRDYDIVLNFEFQGIHSVTYKGITGNFPTEVFHGTPLNVDFNTTKKSMVQVYMDGLLFTDFTYQDGILNIPSVEGNIEVVYTDLSQVILKVKKSITIVDLDSADANTLKQKIKDNVYAVDMAGNKIDIKINYTLDKEIVPNTINSYTIEYQVGDDELNYVVQYEVEDENTTYEKVKPKLIVSIPPSIDFSESTMPYVTYNMTSSLANGYASVRSTALDPMIEIGFDETNYFDPNLYRYAVVRYRSSSASTDNTRLMELYMEFRPKDPTYCVRVQNIKYNGTWIEVVFDLGTNSNIKNLDYINGLRFDFAQPAGVQMDLDYIKFVKTLDIEYTYLENFDTPSACNNYSYTNLRVVSCTDGYLNATSTNGDPQMAITLSKDQYFDPLRYKFMYIRYKLSGNDTLEFFRIPDENYKLAVGLTGNNVWNTVVVDLSANSRILQYGQVNGWRIDPMRTSNKNIQIDYIGVSDRVRS